MKCNVENNPQNWLSIIWQPLVTATTALVLPLTIGNLVPTVAVAQELPVSATWGETVSLTSILKGYESIVLGFEEIGMGGEIVVFDHFLTFSGTFAAFNMTGTIGDMDFFLNGSGSLLGDVGSENLTWTGGWLGSIGTLPVTAIDTGTFSFDAADGYTQLVFQQLGFKDLDIWDATTTAELTSDPGFGIVAPGWSGPGKGAGIGGTISRALADEETVFPSGNSIGSSLIIDGDAQYFLLVLDDGTVIKEGYYSCDLDKNCDKISVPEPTSTVSLLFLLGIGVVRQVKKDKV